VLITTGRIAGANCREFAGFPIFQCADTSFFNPPPDFDPNKYFIDPNNPTAGLQNVTAVFWQVGFGNKTLNTGNGAYGTGNSGGSTFNGNDQGLFPVDLANANSAIGESTIPLGAFCLRSNNWGNSRVDGCCDNDRGTTLTPNNDNLLNPYYDVQYARNYGYPGIYSLSWQQDYPMAVLLTESSGEYFAIAAIATLNRGNTGDAANGPCSATPGANPAPCDHRVGSYSFKAVSNGLENPVTSGLHNVVPWQTTPQPLVTSNTPLDPNDPNSDRVLDVEWLGVSIYSDQSVRPTTHPQMAPADANFASGVGVTDIMAKFSLVRYVLEAAAVSDPNFVSPSIQTETTLTALTGLQVAAETCLRIRTSFGKKPVTTSTSIANCRLGKCGDRGYQVVSDALCLGAGSQTSWVHFPVESAPLSTSPSSGHSTPFAVEGYALESLSATTSATDVVLTASHGPAPTDVTLNWSGGRPPYNVFVSSAKSMTLVASTLASDTTATSLTTEPPQLAYFRVGDFDALGVTVFLPPGGSTTSNDLVTIDGFVDPGASSVSVNNRPALLNTADWDFEAVNVPLQLGDNTISAVVLSPTGNIGMDQKHIFRASTNPPPEVAISLPDGTPNTYDLTPRIRVDWTHPNSDGLDPTPGVAPDSFRAYLDGTDRTDDCFRIGNSTSGFASCDVGSNEVLTPGEHVLLIVVADQHHYFQSSVAAFNVLEPRLISIQPDFALPGDVVTINGHGFEDPASVEVYFGQTQVTPTAVSANQITLTLPQGVTSGPVHVKVFNVETNQIVFNVGYTYIPHSTITTGSKQVMDSIGRPYYTNVPNSGEVHRHDFDSYNDSTLYSGSDVITAIGIDPTSTAVYFVTQGPPIVYVGSDNYPFYTSKVYLYSISTGTVAQAFAIDPNMYGYVEDIDVEPPFLYLSLDRAGGPSARATVLLRTDLNGGGKQELAAMPFVGPYAGPLKIDPVNGTWYWIYGSSLISNGVQVFDGSTLVCGGPFSLYLDCLNRLYFTDGCYTYRLDAPNSASTVVDVGGSNSITTGPKGYVYVDTPFGLSRTTWKISECLKDVAANLVQPENRVYADFDPAIGSPTPNVQYTVLTACLEDPNVPRNSQDGVDWGFADVDDASSDNSIDINGFAGGDNHGGRDSSDWFVPEGNYASGASTDPNYTATTAYDATGCSKVQFHTTDGPGDNFRVRVRLRTRNGEALDRSSVLTVWKRLDVETDSMGAILDPPTASDPMEGDVPDPPQSTLISNAFQSAYVQVAFIGTGSRTNVFFQHNVPPHFLGFQNQTFIIQTKLQGIAGRDQLSEPGRWSVYAQGAYEGPIESDNDPDGKPNTLLGLASPPDGTVMYSLIYMETIRDVCADVGGDEAYERQATTLHEIGHQFGLGDGTLIMSGGVFHPPAFDASVLRSIRYPTILPGD